MVLHGQAGHDDQNAIDAWLSSHPPMSRAMAESVKCCRVEQMHTVECQRFSVKLDAQDAQLEGLYRHLVEPRGALPLRGQAPKGTMEQNTQDLFKQINGDVPDALS